MIILQIILTIIYFILSINPLKLYISLILQIYLNYIQKKGNNPPKKDNLNSKLPNSITKENKYKKTKKVYKNINNEHLTISKSKKKKKSHKKNLESSNSKLNKISNIDNYSKDITIFSYTNPQNNFKGKKISENAEFGKEVNISSLNGFNINIESYLETDFGDLAFEEVIERENRTFCKYLVWKLKSNLLIANIFTNNEPFKPRTIKIMLFIINIELYLFINALFINEEFISDVFNSKNNNFFNFLPRAIDRMFYTTLVKVIVDYIVDFFFIEEKKIKIILKNKKYTPEDVKIKIYKILEIVLKRFIYFIIFSFIISLFFLFYIICFNYKYYYITNEWIKSSIFIILLMQIVSIIIILT